ncbi:hypothetical protein, partial [Bacillus thuringiensis]|uniref:hypothetical protein n=1 Tax=Bacillus thuringiensis TaxID=1428 RepID=UPI002FBEFEB0
MSRIRMKIFIRNESDAKLALANEKLEHGSYTPGWRPPPVINPGERKGFQGEGELIVVPTTGTEGRVRYNIEGGGGELYIHWNSPLMESQYGNTFHIWAPPNWEVSHWGGQGHEAVIEIRLRRTARRSVPNFNPKVNGFTFSNTVWSKNLPVISIGFLWNRLFESLPGPLSTLGISKVLDENFLPITHADAGMCGGMVYAVMDYFYNNLIPPIQTTPPSSPDDPLFKYIRERLWDSFDVDGQGHRFLGYSSPHYPNGDEGVIQNVAGLARGRSWVSYREEWPLIQADIDAGKLSPIGLIQTDALQIGNNHQVLAYAYEKSGQDVTLYIYDPNNPQQETVLKFNITSTSGDVKVTRSFDTKRIFCFFRINGYQPKNPPVVQMPSVQQKKNSSSGIISVVSRISDSMELWWIGANGSVQGAYWYAGKPWARYELAPAGSAALTGSVTVVSRIPDSMELWWIGANGSVQGAYWYAGKPWARYELAPAGSAALTGSVTVISRIPDSMELWWIGANGSVQGAYWYAGKPWARYELAPAGSAALTGSVTVVSRIPDSMELWWIGANGSVQGAYWYAGKPWARYELAPAGSAALTGSVTVVSRIPDSMELWWIG